MLNLLKAPIIEARYMPINPPDMRLFIQAKGTNFFGKLTVDSIADWIRKKTGNPSVAIESLVQLKQRIVKMDNFVVYVGPTTI